MFRSATSRRATVAIIALIVATSFATVQSFAQSTYVFGKAALPASGTGTSLVQGDFNGDGSSDFVWVNPAADTVSIVVSKPNGAFAPKSDYVAAASGSLAVAAIAADFNNDGKLDLAVVDNDGTSSLLLGNGDGTFAARTSLSISASKLAAGDFNHDGNMDLAAALSTGSAVYLGDGKGNFTQDTSVPIGVVATTAGVADFNNDGFADIMFSGIGNATVLLGDGKGGFTTAPTTTGLTLGVIADFNNDGFLDTAYTTKMCGRFTCSEWVYDFLGKGDGTFTEQILQTTVNGQLSAGDFNHDGKMDLLVVPGGILFGNGDGTFQSVSPISPGSPTSAVAGDFNHDGQLDYAALDSGGSLIVALGNLGKFPTPLIQSVTTTFTPNHALFGDFNNDGKLDQLTVDGSMQVSFGNGDGTFQAPINTPINFTYTDGAILGDFNRDGYLDVAILSYGTSLTEFTIYLGNGNGTFQLPIPGLGYNRWPLNGVAVDLNGDGILDLAISAQNGGDDVDVFIGNGDGTFQTNVSYPTCFSGGTVARDFNGDGKLDIAVACNDFIGGTNVLINNGDGTFKAAASYTASNVYDMGIGSGDFNGDGKQDIAVSGFSGITTFLGNGDGTFQTGIATSTGSTAQLVASDFNNDGKSDLLAVYSNNNQGSNSILLFSNGDGTYASSSLPFTGASDPGPVALDLNGDGALDIVSSAPAGTALTTYYMAATPVAFASAAQLNFSYESLGTTSNPLPLTLANAGAAPLNVGTIAATGDFSISNNTCGTTLAINASCTLDVTFTPTATGLRTGTVSIPSNSVGGNSVIALTGTGEGSGPVIVLSPTSLVFGAQSVGTASTPQTILVSSVGGTAVTLTSIVPTGDFTETNNCPTTLAANGGSCTIAVTFMPTASGTRPGSIVVTDSAGTQTATLTGIGIAPVVSLSPSSLTFATQLIKTSSKAKSVTLTNTGSASLSITSIAITGANPADFTETNNCGTTLAINASCAINVTFKPQAINTRSAAVTIIDNASGSPQSVPLSGVGTQVKLSVAALSYGNVTVGTSSTKNLTFTNSGTTTVNITGITIGGTNAGDFTETNNCGSSVAGKKSCTISVTFTPSAKGKRTGTLSVNDDGGGSPQNVSLTGTGK